MERVVITEENGSKAWKVALVSSNSILRWVEKVNVRFQSLLCTVRTQMGYGSASDTGELLLHRHRVGLERVDPSIKCGKFCRRCPLFTGLKNMSSTAQQRCCATPEEKA